MSDKLLVLGLPFQFRGDIDTNLRPCFEGVGYKWLLSCYVDALFFYYHYWFYHHRCCCHCLQRLGPQTYQGVFGDCELVWEIRVPSPRSPIQSQPKALEKTRTWQRLGPEGDISRACWPGMNQILWTGTLKDPQNFAILEWPLCPTDLHWITTPSHSVTPCGAPCHRR